MRVNTILRLQCQLHQMNQMNQINQMIQPSQRARQPRQLQHHRDQTWGPRGDQRRQFPMESNWNMTTWFRVSDKLLQVESNTTELVIQLEHTPQIGRAGQQQVPRRWKWQDRASFGNWNLRIMTFTSRTVWFYWAKRRTTYDTYGVSKSQEQQIQLAYLRNPNWHQRRDTNTIKITQRQTPDRHACCLSECRSSTTWSHS